MKTTLLAALLLAAGPVLAEERIEREPPSLTFGGSLPNVTINSNGVRLSWGSTVTFSEHMVEHEADRVAFYIIVKVGTSHYLVPAHYPVKPQPKGVQK